MTSLKSFTKSSFSKELDAFLRYIGELRGYSEATVKTYRIPLTELKAVVEYELHAEHTVLDILPYRTKVASQSRRTILKKISAIRSFVNYLNDKGYRVKLRGDKSIKNTKTLPKPIETTHIKEALEIAEGAERMAVLLLYGLGLRISELANLRVDDVQNGWVRVVGKGSKTREIPLIEELQRELTHYLHLHAPKAYIFEQDSKRLSENTLRYRIKKLFFKIGVNASPHQLRHSYATDILNNGGRITDVSKLLGHSSLATTEIYTKLNSGIKMQNYLHAHPLCRSSDGN
jgi:integrase/recombinase XerC